MGFPFNILHLDACLITGKKMRAIIVHSFYEGDEKYYERGATKLFVIKCSKRTKNCISSLQRMFDVHLKHHRCPKCNIKNVYKIFGYPTVTKNGRYPNKHNVDIVCVCVCLKPPRTIVITLTFTLFNSLENHQTRNF